MCHLSCYRMTWTRFIDKKQFLFHYLLEFVLNFQGFCLTFVGPAKLSVLVVLIITIQASSSPNCSQCCVFSTETDSSGLDYLMSLKGWMSPTAFQVCTFQLDQLSADLLCTPMNCHNQQEVILIGLHPRKLLFPPLLVFWELVVCWILFFAFAIMLFIPS